MKEKDQRANILSDMGSWRKALINNKDKIEQNIP